MQEESKENKDDLLECLRKLCPEVWDPYGYKPYPYEDLLWDKESPILDPKLNPKLKHKGKRG